MSKRDVGAGLGVAAALAICCGAHLLVLTAAASGLALLAGQFLVAAVATALLLGTIGVYVWRWRVNQCATGICAPREEQSAIRFPGEDRHLTETLAERDPVTVGRDDGR